MEHWYILVLEHCSTPVSPPVWGQLCTAELQPAWARIGIPHGVVDEAHLGTPLWQLALEHIGTPRGVVVWEHLGILHGALGGEYFCILAWMTVLEHSGTAVLALVLALACTLHVRPVWAHSGILVWQLARTVRVGPVGEPVWGSGCSFVFQLVWGLEWDCSGTAGGEPVGNLVWVLVLEPCCRFLWAPGCTSGFLAVLGHQYILLWESVGIPPLVSV